MSAYFFYWNVHGKSEIPLKINCQSLTAHKLKNKSSLKIGGKSEKLTLHD